MPGTTDSANSLDAVERAHRSLGLTYREIAEIIGADESSLHRWRRGESEPSLVFSRQLRQLDRCLDQLANAFEGWDDARDWMSSRPTHLGGEQPFEVLLAGEADRVIGALFVMNHTSSTSPEGT